MSETFPVTLLPVLFLLASMCLLPDTVQHNLCVGLWSVLPRKVYTLCGEGSDAQGTVPSTWSRAWHIGNQYIFVT